MIAPERPETVRQDLHEPGVAVDHRHPEPGLGALRGSLSPGLRVAVLYATWAAL